jgi:tetratricopeptide (TPR) repeat protein
MRSFAVLFAFLSAGFPLSCFAQTVPATRLDQYRNEALIWEHFDTTIHMHADGTGDRTVHIVARLQSEGAARQFSVLAVAFASAYETGSIDYVRVRKPDGSTIETPTADAIEMPAPVTSEAPLYSDLKQKQLPVRSLAAGDVIEYQLRTVRNKAEAPGQFWGSEHFLADAGVVLSQTLTLEVPDNIYLQVWNPNHPTTPTQHDGLRTYIWNTTQLKSTGKGNGGASQQNASTTEKIHDPDEDAEGRKLPSVAWTTFHSWAELGNWYRSLALSRSDPTPAIISRANDLTRDAKTPEEQVRALYDFVSTSIRYVGIDFGVGRYQPHMAEEVLAYQYGDCKDKDTLLEALLRAKGLTTAPALIGLNIMPVPDVPSPALFNHVITTVDLPGGRIWLDTTPEVAPYRVLVPLIRDEQALVVPAQGVASLQRTPADPPFAYFERFEAVGTLDRDGLLKSHMDMTMRSDNELGFRILLQRAAPSQWDEAMQSVSRSMGFTGTVSNTDLKQKDQAAPVHLSYDYTRPSFADWEHQRILPLFPVLEITYIDRETAPEHDIDQGTPRKLEALTRIKLPAGYTADLPDAIHVKRDYASFDQTYKVEKDELIIERTVVILKQKVAEANWNDYYAYTKVIGAESGENYISLTAPPISLPEIASPNPSALNAKNVEPKPAEASSSPVGQGAAPSGAAAANAENSAQAMAEFMAQQAMLGAMMKAARDLELDGKWDAAHAMLNEVKSKDPDYPYVMSMLGFIARHDKKQDEAIRDYETEVNRHREVSSSIVTELASLYVSQRRYGDAEALLRKYLERNDSILFTELAYAQTRSGDDASALATLRGALAAHPNDVSIEAPLAAALYRTHRDKEAAATAKMVLLQSTDQNLLNNEAYLLSEMKLELPLAEASSRRTIKMLETASTQVTLQDAKEKAFSQTNLLAAAWDTLGWILFREGRPAEAEPYIRAAWFNHADVVVGDHLAQVLEALHKPSEALTINEQALGSDGVDSHPEENAEVRRNIERLRQAATNASAEEAKKTLQDMRTFRIAKPADVTGSGIFRVAIADKGVEENNLVNGPSEMRTLGTELNKLRMPGALPPGSQARLFHDGTLTCSLGNSTCEFQLLSHSGLAAEGVR